MSERNHSADAGTAAAVVVRANGLAFDAWRAVGTSDESVLLLHGFPQSSRVWSTFWAPLTAAGLGVVAFDQRGYSATARPGSIDAYSMPHLVADALAVLDALEIEEAHVVGHDWGAAVGWQLAARHPDRVATLAALSVPHPNAFRSALQTDADQRSRSAYMRLFASAGSEGILLGDGPDSLRAFFAGCSADVDVDHWLDYIGDNGRLTEALGWYRASRAEHFADVPPVTVPTLYVWSDEDRALGRAAARGTADWVVGAYRYVELTGVSHWVPEEAGHRVAALVTSHVLDHGPAAG